jgi:hypothetical protein
MPISRDTITTALYDRLQSKVTLCNTFARKWIAAQDIGTDQQPALLLLEGDESSSADPMEPPLWTMEFAVVVYVRTNDVDSPGAKLSNIIDQIEGALERQTGESVLNTHYNTSLGIPKQVQRAWIAGPIEKEDGSNTGGQGWISLTIHVWAIPG